ncbi:MAG: tetratricopeptide repeat protein [Vicinamibacterales bacterium]
MRYLPWPGNVRTRRRFALAALFVIALPGVGRTQSSAPTPILVLPFENTRPDSQRIWLREAAALLLTDALASSGEVAIGRTERLVAFERLQIPPLASLSRASVIKVGQTVGAVSVVIGSLDASAIDLTVRARVIRLDTGRLMPEVSVNGPTNDLFGVFGQLASGLKTVGQPSTSASGDWRPPSHRAFEFYVKALIADTAAAQIVLLEQALKDAPAYTPASIALWQVHTEAGDHQLALTAISSAAPGRPLAREARFLAALSQIHLKKFDDAFHGLRELQTETPSAAVANAMGVLELRRSATPQPGRATYYFSQATDLDEADGDLFFNLGYAYWLERDLRAAIYWLREAVRRDPTDGDAHFILGAALQQGGATSEAAREKELALRLSSKYATWDAKGTNSPDLTPRGLERLHEDLTNAASRVNAMVMTAGQRDQDELARFHLEAGRRAFDRDADREAVVELRRALYLSPYLAEAHTLLGRIYLRAGRLDEAIDALKIALWSDETAATHVLLAEAYLQAHDAAAARTEVDRALALDPKSADAQRLKAKLTGPPW